MDVGGYSVAGPRPENEDSYAYKDFRPLEGRLGGLLAFLVVSDGMGGHQRGDLASRLAVGAAISYVDDLLRMAAESFLEVDPALALKEITREAHQAVVRAAQTSDAAPMGATLTAAFVSANRAWIGHVGDSRAYILGGGDARQITRDHSQIGRMMAEGVLTEQQAQAHPDRNVIERALGFEGAEAEVDEVPLGPGQALLLCTDGLSTVLSAKDSLYLASSAGDAGEAAAKLANAAIAAGTDDNTTAVLWSDDWSRFCSTAPKLRRTLRTGGLGGAQVRRHKGAQRLSVVAIVVVAVVAVVVVGWVVATSGGSARSGAGVATTQASNGIGAATTLERTTSSGDVAGSSQWEVKERDVHIRRKPNLAKEFELGLIDQGTIFGSADRSDTNKKYVVIDKLSDIDGGASQLHLDPGKSITFPLYVLRYDGAVSQVEPVPPTTNATW